MHFSNNFSEYPYSIWKHPKNAHRGVSPQGAFKGGVPPGRILVEGVYPQGGLLPRGYPLSADFGRRGVPSGRIFIKGVPPVPILPFSRGDPPGLTTRGCTLMADA